MNASRLFGALLLVVSAPAAFAEAMIAFQADSEANLEIHMMKEGETTPSNRTRHASADWRPSICPEGSKLVWSSNRDASDGSVKNVDIFVMRRDAPDAINLTQLDIVTDDEADCGAPNGVESILFSSNRDGDFEIYRMRTDGTQLVKLTDNTHDDTEPTWCGDKIVFVSNRDGNQELYRASEWGLSQTRLTHHASADVNPNCSPDGRWVAFSRGGIDADIFEMPIGGGPARNLTPNTPSLDKDPTWSPGGTQIVFASNRDGDLEIWRMARDGSALQQLTFNTSEDAAPDCGELVGFAP